MQKREDLAEIGRVGQSVQHFNVSLQANVANTVYDDVNAL